MCIICTYIFIYTYMAGGWACIYIYIYIYIYPLYLYILQNNMFPGIESHDETHYNSYNSWHGCFKMIPLTTNNESIMRTGMIWDDVVFSSTEPFDFIWSSWNHTHDYDAFVLHFFDFCCMLHVFWHTLFTPPDTNIALKTGGWEIMFL